MAARREYMEYGKELAGARFCVPVLLCNQLNIDPVLGGCFKLRYIWFVYRGVCFKYRASFIRLQTFSPCNWILWHPAFTPHMQSKLTRLELSLWLSYRIHLSHFSKFPQIQDQYDSCIQAHGRALQARWWDITTCSYLIIFSGIIDRLRTLDDGLPWCSCQWTVLLGFGAPDSIAKTAE